MSQEDKKRRAAEHALEFLADGQVVGLGTGSTAKFAIEGIARRISEGMSIKGVSTSLATERIARALRIPLVGLNDVESIDVTFDGADEVDSDFNMRKDGEAQFVTDNGNYILDCDFGPIDNPSALESRIKLLPGVIESGLFIGIADTLVIGLEDRVEVRYRMR